MTKYQTGLSSELLHNVVARCPAGIVVANLAGVILDINPEIERIMGYGRHELVGQPIAKLVPEEARPRHNAGYQAYAQNPSQRRMGNNCDVFGRRADGSLFPVEIGINSIGEGDDMVLVASVVDLSERRRLSDTLHDQDKKLAAQAGELAKQAAELRRTNEVLNDSNRTLEHFANVVAHDLRAPLRHVSASLQVLEHDLGDELCGNNAKILQAAVTGARRASAMVADLLELARVQGAEKEFEIVDSALVFDTAKDNLDDEINDAGATISCKTRLPKVRGNATMLIQLLQNLMGNSIRYRGDNPPKITLNCKEEQIDGAAMWLFNVDDNGVGVRPEERERIFEIFARGADQVASSCGRPASEGTGIGLAICKHVVEHHSGRIWVDASPIGGSRFCFTLPKV